MAQYPQGIFQSLQWLLKKVKILGLQKQTVYPVINTPSSYILPGKGVYTFTGAGSIVFPSADLMQGQTIVILATTANINISSVSSIVNGTSAITALGGGSASSLTAANGIWYLVSQT
jgi:hypothetical protein